ncbi:hypothetical protein KFU94_33120 [Chloroflexi bacterium TSY]|nr:hypothetical protein [Chloroflexi bacterium TSY]
MYGNELLQMLNQPRTIISHFWIQRQRWKLLWGTFVVAVLPFVVACTPRLGSGEMDPLADQIDLFVDLPALMIEYDTQGNVSFGDMPIEPLVELMIPGGLASLILTQGTLDFVLENNIQHIQINNRLTGPEIIVNGLSLPSLKWDDQSLKASAQTIQLLGGSQPILEKVLPLVRQLGIAVTIRFPVQSSHAIIPLVPGDAETGQTAERLLDKFLSSVGRQPEAYIPVYYQADGSWTVSGMTDEEYMVLAPFFPWTALRLRPQVVQSLIASNISQIYISTNVDGIFLGLNGKMLPHIGWKDGEMQNVLELADQLGVWATLAANGINLQELIGLVETVLPIVQATNMVLVVHLPER